MKKNYRIFGLILSMIIAISAVLSLNLVAEAAEDYTYTVKFVIGDKQFSFKDDLSGILTYPDDATVKITDEAITISNLKIGGNITIDPQQAVNNDSDKYVVKEIRKSGDYNPVANSITVSQDETYVIAYGVGTVVTYTVDYKGPGISGQPTTTYYGIKGQKDFYIPYKYIDGFVVDTSKGGYEYVNGNIHVTAPLAGGEHFEFTYKENKGSTTTNTVYDETTNTIYSTEVGDPQYDYARINGEIPAEPEITNNRAAADQNQNAAGGQEAGEGAEDQGTAIGEEQVPLGGEEAVEIPEEEPPKNFDEKEKFKIYIRYLIIIAIIGLLIALISIIGSMKVNYDKKHRN